jgi:hypothetical protein
MMVVMLVAGIGAVVAGLVAILYGIPVKEFSFGNTMIFAGVIGLCTGMIVLCISAVVAELKLIARRLADPRAITADARARMLLPSLQQPTTADEDFLFTRDRAAAENTGNVATPGTPSASAAPWQEETGTRARKDGKLESEPGGPASSAAASKPRRNLMFSSSMRRDRERAQARAADLSAPDAAGPPVPPAQESEAAPGTFDDAWPRNERGKAGEISAQRRSGRVPSTFAEDPAAAERQPSPATAEDPPEVTVIKSGVVDGMAYSLYSDGSIEAQLPEGLMRFASLDELTAHIERRP